MYGRLIFVSGLSGAGKTTLIKHALESIPNTAYLKTYTTRPRRTTETNSFEYVFVTDEEYEKFRSQSKLWDHTAYGGYSYGADVEQTKTLLANGTNIICSVAPDEITLDEMTRLYGIEPITVWIDTAPQIALQRIKDDEIRAGRVQDEQAKQRFKYSFEPVDDASADGALFVGMLQKLLA